MCHYTMVAAYLAYTVGFQYMANLPIEKELYLGVAARFWMQSDVAAGFIMGVGAALVISYISGSVTGAAGRAGRETRGGGVGAGAVMGRGGRNGGGWGGRRGKGGGGKGGRGLEGGGGGGSGGNGDGGGVGGHQKRRRTVEVAALGVALSLLAGRVCTNYSAMNERDNNMFEDFGREMLRPLPPNARLIVKGTGTHGTIHDTAYTQCVVHVSLVHSFVTVWS